MLFFLSLSVLCTTATEPARTTVTVQDFENTNSLPRLWVVNIPDDFASVSLKNERAQGSAKCLCLRYKFNGGGEFQYLGIANKTRILAPIHQLQFMIHGDNSRCSYGVQITDIGGETHQYGKNTGQCGLIDFSSWKKVEVNLESGHETWGGDKNGKIDYPITAITLTIGQPTAGGKPLPVEGSLDFDSLSVSSDRSSSEVLGCQIAVASPAYCSDIKGRTPVVVKAAGMSQLTAKCWKQGGRFGTDCTVANVDLDAQGKGSFTFPADQFPHGPLTLRIQGAVGQVKDTCYLQLYNQGGVSWNEGIPRVPPQAQGMKLVFWDDFRQPLSISSTDPKATYYDHKPPDGHQDFSVHTFSGQDSAGNPFAQVDSYLRIRARDKTHSTGLICSLRKDASGVKVSAPCYFECRFIGPNAIGTWPAFWLMTDYMSNYHVLGDKTPCDELDVIEAYGGEGPGEPNADDTYMVTPHCWNQGEPGKADERKAFEAMHNPIRMRERGIPSTWFESPHVYGCKVTKTATVYYCDDIEVGRHATLPLSQERPLFFLINLATGGGWPVDLSRYDGMADMYVDYVRVFGQVP